MLMRAQLTTCPSPPTPTTWVYCTQLPPCTSFNTNVLASVQTALHQLQYSHPPCTSLITDHPFFRLQSTILSINDRSACLRPVRCLLMVGQAAPIMARKRMLPRCHGCNELLRGNTGCTKGYCAVKNTFSKRSKRSADPSGLS